MYEQFFNLHIRPFTTTPYVKHYFATQSMHKALSQCQRSVERGSGPVVVVGNLGTGKSLLLNLLAEQFKDRFRVVDLSCTRLEHRHELLQSMLFHLNQPYRDMSEVELRLALIDYLKPGGECPNGIVMLVDEAHRLSCELLDEFRLITNIVHESQPRVRMVMAGGFQFEENLTNPKLESFNQRIAARCFLANLVRDETIAYVIDHIYRAGGDGQAIFSACALDCIHETSGGCPRLINQLCDHAMLLAAGANTTTIDQQVVREAWADIQCIPDASIPGSGNSDVLAPRQEMNHEPLPSVETEDSGSVIEFGELNDGPYETEGLGEPVTGRDEMGYGQLDGDKPATMEVPSENDDRHPSSGDLAFGFSSDTNTDQENVSPGGTPLEPIGESYNLVPLDSTTGNEGYVNSPECNRANENSDLYPQDQSIVDMETPYDDSFVEEVLPGDPCVLNVTEQNIKSLEVTQDHMRLLEDSYRTEADSLPSSNPGPGADGPSTVEEITQEREITEEQIKFQQPVPVESTPDPAVQLFQGLAEGSSIENKTTDDPNAVPQVEGQATDELRLTEHELHELDLVATAVERLERCQSGTTAVTDGTKCEEPADLSEPMVPMGNADGDHSNTGSLEDEYPDLNALSEAEQLLEQIRRFTERDQGTGRQLPYHAEASGESEAELNDAADMESAMAQNENYHEHPENKPSGDDRDMLVVSRSERLNHNAAEVENEVSDENESPSTGQAKRMDYHKLFEQLRNE